MPPTDPLLRTKLRPPFIRPGLVARPRLQAALAAGLAGPLTLVVAPAGFGKTTLVAASLAGWSGPVGWLSLERGDNQPGRFLRYLLAALQAADARLGGEAVQLLAGLAGAEAVLTSLVNDLEAGGGQVGLVLDDYQFIRAAEVHDALAFLLEHAPPCFHLLLPTRSDPPLPLARLRARGQLVELRAADLRFSEAEAGQFLNGLMGLGLDAGAVGVLEARTEGWVAGLQMAALSLRDRADVGGFIAGFSGTNRHILDYLLAEILASQPAGVQTFLLQTALLERLSAPLCAAILAGGEVSGENGNDTLTSPLDSRAILEYLERENLFVVGLDEERVWYRYHQLFADLLRARLQQAHPDADPHPACPRFRLVGAEWIHPRSDPTPLRCP